MAEQFSATDLHRNTIVFSGHHFLCTIFTIKRYGGRVSVHYCGCGEMAVRDESTGNFMGLSSDASDCQIRSCRLTKLI